MGKFDLQFDFPIEKTRKAVSRVVDSRGNWHDKVSRSRAYTGLVRGDNFSFKKVEGNSLLLGLNYEGTITPRGEGSMISLRVFLGIPGLLISLILLALALFLVVSVCLQAWSGDLYARFLIAPAVTGLAIVYFNSFFPMREEKLRTRVNLLERIENMTFEESKPKYETDGLFD